MYKNIVTQKLCNPLLKFKGLEADVLRLDLMHPVISGNKWFKLKYHIAAALQQGKKGMVSFGGAYSNHLVAMACSCQEHGLLSAGMIRGEEIRPDNPSLRQMEKAGMNILFVNREDYRDKVRLTSEFLSSHPDFYYVPEGGQSAEGINGAKEILPLARNGHTHIICSVGTGTTLAGIINAADPHQQVYGISSLKINDTKDNLLMKFLRTNTSSGNFSIIYDYHFGGYAKRPDTLIAFMNEFYNQENIPSDFVYTGKMFFAVDDMIKKDYFSRNAKLLMIHTGGLQGNHSLPQGTLVF